MKPKKFKFIVEITFESGRSLKNHLKEYDAKSLKEHMEKSFYCAIVKKVKVR